MFKELVPFAKLAKFSVLGPGDTGFVARLNAFLAQPFIERANVDAEVLRDLRERDFWAAI